MSRRLRAVSGKRLLSLLTSIDYSIVRQRGSHVRLEKATPAGIHKITIPLHDTLAKGTLNGILAKVSIWNQISKEKLIEQL